MRVRERCVFPAGVLSSAGVPKEAVLVPGRRRHLLHPGGASQVPWRKSNGGANWGYREIPK